MLRNMAISLVLLLTGCTNPIVSLHFKDYKLVWSDAFDGAEIDDSKWTTRQKDGMHGKSRIRDFCTQLDGKGNAVLVTQLVSDESKVGYEIESGMISTDNLHFWKYGLFEARIKFESAAGHHGAFWLQSPHYGVVTDDFAASGVEIDIVEYFGNDKLSQNLHWNKYGSKEKRWSGSGNLINAAIGTVDSAFHVYSLLWTPEEYVFYIDGIETWRTSEAVSHHEEFIILSLLSATWEAKKLKPENFPDTMEVDWVRVFQR